MVRKKNPPLRSFGGEDDGSEAIVPEASEPDREDQEDPVSPGTLKTDRPDSIHSSHNLATSSDTEALASLTNSEEEDDQNGVKSSGRSSVVIGCGSNGEEQDATTELEGSESPQGTALEVHLVNHYPRKPIGGADDTPGAETGASSPKLQDFKCNICGYGYYGNDPTDLIKHFRKYHLGLHNRTRQDAELDNKILAMHNVMPLAGQAQAKEAVRTPGQTGQTGQTGGGPESGVPRISVLNGTYDHKNVKQISLDQVGTLRLALFCEFWPVTLASTFIGIGRKTQDCQGNTKYFRCKFCNFTYMGSSSVDLEQHFLATHPNKMKSPPPSNSSQEEKSSTERGSSAPYIGADDQGKWADREAVRAEDESVAGYSVPLQAPDSHGGTVCDPPRAYYWCKHCSFSCEASDTSRLLEHYEAKHYIREGSPINTERNTRDKDSLLRKKEKSGMTAEAETVVTSYNCQFCDFRYSMTHGADVIVVGPLLHHYQRAHSIHKCTIKHCPFCPRGLCTPDKHLGEISYPFACRKSSCSHCALLLLQLTSGGNTTPSSPAPRASVTHLCDQCPFTSSDIDLLLLHYDSTHTSQTEVKPEEEGSGDGAMGPRREYTCTKCHFCTDVEEEIFRHYRRVHGCCRCRHCSFTAPDTTSLLDHFNSAHCQDTVHPSNGCSAPSTLRIKEESKGDLKLYSLAPPEASRAEPVSATESMKSEAQDEEKKIEKGWVEAMPGSAIWVPKERSGEILRGSPAPFGQGTLGLLSAITIGGKEQQKGAAVLRETSGLIFSLGSETKNFLPGTPSSGGEKQQYSSSAEGKGAKEESQSLL
ncbi:hypothetical protein DNTS_003598, partial [Danionella cerebrum]